MSFSHYAAATILNFPGKVKLSKTLDYHSNIYREEQSDHYTYRGNRGLEASLKGPPPMVDHLRDLKCGK
ncbi:MAG: hypothetical protein NPIRA06_00810 [Nitrospirales bacterium]|nr:MAG: hypothetical protein NPIRA06_00810 [Nitrospirales bacterium]